jgi:hypothetical protein
MYYTFAQAKEKLGRFADGGCEKAGDEINASLERLMDAGAWKDTRSVMKMCVVDSVFPLPQNVETIERLCVNGTPVEIFGTEYQFLPGGPGDLDFRVNDGYGYQDLTDAGEHSTMFDIPLDADSYKLVAFSRYLDDSAKQIHIQGYGAMNEELRETLRIGRWNDGIEGVVEGPWGAQNPVTVNTFRSVTRVILPDNLRGYVSLYAVIPSTNVMRFLAKYNPSVPIPNFHRYRFIRPLDTATGYAIVAAEVRLRFLPLADDYDIIPIDGLQALQNMMQARAAEAAGNLQVANGFEMNAVRLLSDKQRAKKGPTYPTIRSPARLSPGRGNGSFYGV